MKKMRYVKFSFWERIQILLHGLVPEDALPEKEVIKYIPVKEKETIIEKSQKIASHPIKQKDTIEKSEEEQKLPFFDINKSEGKSNF